jgi:hypothetical protein
MVIHMAQFSGACNTIACDRRISKEMAGCGDGKGSVSKV